MTGLNHAYSRRLTAGTDLYRIHGTRPGSVAFGDTSRGGRFNLIDVPDRGTCYLSDEPLGAYVETLGRILGRSPRDLGRRRLSVLTLTRDAVLFDVNQSEARSAYQDLGIDVTGEVDSGSDYNTSQQLASFTHADGYDGIYYTVRHDNTHTLKGIALFGPAGPNDTTSLLRDPKTDHIPTGLVDEACARYGFRILPEPPD